MTVRVFVRGDVDGDGSNEWYTITADPGGAGQLTLVPNAQTSLADECSSTFVDANSLGVISITQTNFNNIISNDGSFTLSATAGSGVNASPTFCPFNDVRIELSYQICSAPPSPSVSPTTSPSKEVSQLIVFICCAVYCLYLSLDLEDTSVQATRFHITTQFNSHTSIFALFNLLADSESKSISFKKPKQSAVIITIKRADINSKPFAL